MGVYLRGKTWYLDFYYEGKRYTESIGKDGPVNKTLAKEKLIIRQRKVIPREYKPKVVQVAFSDFKKQYLEYSRVNKKPRSAIRDECSLKRLAGFFETKMLSQISPLMVEGYKRIRKEEGAAPATINRELGCLRHMFNMALKWKRVTTNAVSEVKFLREPKGRKRILSEEEEYRLFDEVRFTTKSKHLEPIIITALNAGMRKGEILNLKWVNVDFTTGHITVVDTKNGEIRKVPMNKKLTEALQNARKVSKGEYVFSENGKPYTDVKTGWWSALERAGIKGFRFHDLRHTFGTRLGMKGYDLKTIMELMGIKDPTVAMIYLNPTPEHKRKAVESLDQVTSTFTTQANPDENRKVVSIR